MVCIHIPLDVPVEGEPAEEDNVPVLEDSDTSEGSSA